MIEAICECCIQPFYAQRYKRNSGRARFCSRKCFIVFRLCHKELYRIPVEKRFWSKVDKTSTPEDCWPWTGSKDKLGYGSFTYESYDTRPAHRVSYELTYGPVLPCIDILHQCDNPPCVRPTHLKPGSHSDNMQDAWNRGGNKKRRVYGTMVPNGPNG